jgi:hypothetical protein
MRVRMVECAICRRSCSDAARSPAMGLSQCLFDPLDANLSGAIMASLPKKPKLSFADHG